MKYNQKKAVDWLNSLDGPLPNLIKAIDIFSGDIIVLGANVFELYAIQSWVPSLKRKTGDVDLSLGVSSSSNKYVEVAGFLKSKGYHQDAKHSYRYHPPKQKLGVFAYLDLLAHPTQIGEDHLARIAMGVGEGFNLEGMKFAVQNSFQINSRVSFPNPVAFANLKRLAYLDDPNQRRKDLADIIELGSGLVRNQIHFELEDLWEQIKDQPETLQVKEMYLELAEGNNPKWDIWEVESDLKSRGFVESELEERIPSELKDLVEIGLSSSL